jgi:anti-sigma regulatory factor (Ser/Thr protein kinase)
MKHQIEVPGEWDSIATLLAFSDSVEGRLPLTADQSYLLRLVIEEIATNIVKYGYSDATRDVIELSCGCEGATLQVRIRDRGRPFDPRAHADPDLGSDPATRDVGGLGLFFVRELADTIAYHHDPASGWNELIVTKGP